MTKKICIIRDDRLGDLILTLPVIECLKQKYDVNITLVSSAINKTLADRTKLFNKILIFKKDFLSQFRLLKEIRKDNYDYIINCSPFKNRIYKFFIKADLKISPFFLSRYKNTTLLKIRIIQWLFRKFNYRIRIIERYGITNTPHQTKIVLELFEKIGFNLKETKPYEFPNNSLKEKKRVVIHLSNNWLIDERINDLENLITLIVERNFYSIVLTTEKKINSGFDSIIKGLSRIKVQDKILTQDENKVQVCFEPSLDDWIKVLGSAEYIITPECGCSHVSAMLNQKTIIIYDNNNFPEQINKEYEPFKREYFKLIFKRDNIIEEILKILR